MASTTNAAIMKPLPKCGTVREKNLDATEIDPLRETPPVKEGENRRGHSVLPLSDMRGTVF